MRFVKRLLGAALGLAALALALFLLFAPGVVDRRLNPVIEGGPWYVSPPAQALHADLTIGDWHADSLLWQRDLLVRNTRGHVDLPRLIEGNVALQVFTAVTKSPQGQSYVETAPDGPDRITWLAMAQLWPMRTWDNLLERALYQAQRLRDYERRSDALLTIIETRSDLEQVLAARARGNDTVGAILGVEGAHPLGGNMANLNLLQDAGFRLIGLHHFFDNALGDTLHDAGDEGLSDFGRAVVREVEERGMILDVAHSGEQVVRDVLAITDMPIVVSHTGIYSHCPGPRNIADDLMQAVAAEGGVIGIGFWADVTCDASPAGVASAILAAIALVGVDHVSLGSDYDGTVAVSFEASDLAALTHALRDAGLADADIRKVMGENMVRVLRARLP